MNILDRYKSVFLDYLESKIETSQEPVNLYEPIFYILRLGGKRLRPVLTLLSCELFGEHYKKALDAALAVEMFHNFSLVHDDIMDAAPLRRGLETVHEKWSVNTGILSGDAMLVMANQLLECYEGSLYRELVRLFNKTALEVCEGQQYDFDFESRSDVTSEEYIYMIKLKTAVLVATSLQFGAMIAGASGSDQEGVYNFGINLGLAFQLQDDYLDVFGEEDFGKQKAGDIIENKKTILYLKCMELSNQDDRKTLQHLYKTKLSDNKRKISDVIGLFRKYELPKLMEREVENYTNIAMKNLNELDIDEVKKNILKSMARQLMSRKI